MALTYPILARPARASTTPSSSPSPTWPSLALALPRIGTHRRSPRSPSSCAARRGEPVPILAPAGRSTSLAPSRATSASLGASRRGTAASTMPAAEPVGRSFSECTARSTSPPSSASRSALTKTPVPPIWVSCAWLTSPSVVSPTISTWRPVRPVIMSATWRDCAIAIGLLRLPSRSVRSFTRASSLPRPRSRGLPLTATPPAPWRRG